MILLMVVVTYYNQMDRAREIECELVVQLLGMSILLETKTKSHIAKTFYIVILRPKSIMRK